MLRLSVNFLVIAFVAALLGFGGVAGITAESARVFAVLLLIPAVLIIFLDYGYGRGRDL